jgi:hypothetical protein
MYLIIFTILGGLLATFAVAGWGSYSEGKLPATQTLFRWFLAGITTAGISSYVWLFGAGGDPSKLLEKVGEALEVKEIMEKLTAPTGGAVEVLAEGVKPVLPLLSTIPAATPVPTPAPVLPQAITVGMPNF